MNQNKANMFKRGDESLRFCSFVPQNKLSIRSDLQYCFGIWIH